MKFRFNSQNAIPAFAATGNSKVLIMDRCPEIVAKNQYKLCKIWEIFKKSTHVQQRSPIQSTITQPSPIVFFLWLDPCSRFSIFPIIRILNSPIADLLGGRVGAHNYEFTMYNYNKKSSLSFQNHKWTNTVWIEIPRKRSNRTIRMPYHHRAMVSPSQTDCACVWGTQWLSSYMYEVMIRWSASR